ncbi:TonB-dependent receptor [Flagellatimonas centrodinii]|uniref:TonB-dependent receptor domain-containing protein n=1 Tax=Flagellatimonas centrodinii TaxID=2806210 RepID=UPI001FEDE887|nr:TonB-dependent receptor [Flagellatimonas centrodinii]ULQ47281.1 TonB-dependent receptor [Flagellatimonas centrodinii]
MSESRFGPAQIAGALLLAWGGLALAPGAWAQGNSAADLTAATAVSARTTSFDIPSQDLGTALAEFGRQSGQELFFAPDAVVGKVATPVSGNLSREQAIEQLLQGTALEYLFTPDGGLMVGEPAAVERYQRQLLERSRGQGAEVALADPNANGELFDPTVDTTPAPGGTAAVEMARRRGVEEIIVTGQKREERLQDVPIAISAFTMEDLTKGQIAGGPDLITQVPNMTFTKTNFTGYNIQIRGIGTQAISATTDPAVAVAMNNTTFISNRFFEQEFYDLERVEVLRGPQGTLYGRNATAGVVNLITNKPKFDAEARASLDMGNYNSSRWEGMLNIPLLEDTVAFRVAGAGTTRDGYATNDITGSPIDGRDLFSTRMSLRIQPNDRIDAIITWEHFEEDDDRLRSGKQLCTKDVVTEVGGVPQDYFSTDTAGGQSGALFAGTQATLSQGCTRGSLYDAAAFQTPNGLMLPYYVPLSAIGLPTALDDPYLSTTQSQDLRAIESTIDPVYRASADIGHLQLDIGLTDSLTLTSETAYGLDSAYSLQDFNRFNTAPGAWATDALSVDNGVLDENGVFCDPQLGCSDRLVGVDIASSESEQLSQELRLASAFDGPFNFSLGANYLRFDTEVQYQVFFNSISLIAARNPYRFNPDPLPDGPYVAGQSDNSGCLLNGYAPGNPDDLYTVQGCTYIDPNSIDSVNDQGHNYFLSRNPYGLRSYGLFGETYYNITDNLKLTAGLRWSVDRKTAPRIPTWLLVTGTYGYPVADVERQEWREPTGRLVLDWKPNLSFTDETLLYGSYSRGYKAGGANPPGFVRSYYADPGSARAAQQASATRPKTFDAEFVNAFEIGTKNTLLDGRLTANLAAFYYDYTDYQVSEIVDRSAFNRNFDTEVWGAEIELDWYARENLLLGLKTGYQKTRIADGEAAVDLMDRTAGNEDWVVVRPFPTIASSCILPTMVFLDDPDNPTEVVPLGGVGGGGVGGCEIAYGQGYDPVTQLPYVPDPTIQLSDLTMAEREAQGLPGGIARSQLDRHTNYPGFDPATAPNNGEGFAKELGGNELPNAPNYTATVSADYTIPLSSRWLMNLHTDLHWQSESWWRVFNDHEFNRLDEYFTMNLAAIFVNDVDGWNIMAYIKNVTDETAISGAFLNSDDTGLTSNVFLTEPRLFGLRVTKNWNGSGVIRGFGARRPADHRFPLTLALGGQVLKIDAPTTPVAPSFGDAFSGALDIFDGPQNESLSWGDGRSIGLTWNMGEGPWALAGQYRFGSTTGKADAYAEQFTDPVCTLAGGILELQNPEICSDPNSVDGIGQFLPLTNFSIANNAAISIRDREAYRFSDLTLWREWRFGGLERSAVGIGLRRGRLDSDTDVALNGIPDWNIPENIVVIQGLPGNLATRTLYNADIAVRRQFEGTGLMVNWEAANRLFDGGRSGVVDLDWGLTGGILHGDQRVTVSGREKARVNELKGGDLIGLTVVPPSPSSIEETDIPRSTRTRSENVPVVGASLGLTYRVGGFSIGTAYRWERYIDAIDGGADTPESYDRTIKGPTTTISLDFGG